MVEDVEQLLKFLTAAFNATSTTCTKDTAGHVAHAEMQIGDSKLMIGRARENTRENTDVNQTMLYLYMENTDEYYQQALAAGGISLKEPTDLFYGDRNAGIQGPCGNQWWIATHIEDVSPEELTKRAQAYQAEEN